MSPLLAEMTDIVRGVLHMFDLNLTLATRFEDLPGWDSMHLVAVVVDAEFRFGLRFEIEQIEAIHTIGDLVYMIARKRTPAAA